MKKKILSLVVASLAFTSALNADIKYRDIHAGIAQANIADESSIDYSLGYGYAKTFQNGIYFGGALDFDVTDINQESVYTYSVNLKLGYEVIENVALYGIGAVAYQNSGGGFGYGVGAEYILSDSFALSAEYQTYSVAPEFYTELSYDYDKASLTLKYLF